MNGIFRHFHRTATATASCLAFALWLGAAHVDQSTAESPSAISWLSLADDGQVESLLSRMTLKEKIGQMTQAELSSLGDLTPIADLALGSVLCGGGSDPEAGNSPQAWADAVDACQAQSLRTRLKIPLLFGVDAVHGHNNVLGATIFPHNVGLGCMQDPSVLERIGRATAEEMRATGANWTFAPCVTVPRDDRWGRTYEGYGETPSISGSCGSALVRGLQGSRIDDPQSVLACAKHFVGDGATAAELKPDEQGNNPRLTLDQGDARVDEQTLRSIHIAPYRDAIAAGVGSIMVSYSSWNGLKCTANRHLLTDVLKNELGFQGIVVTDYNAIAQTDADSRTAVKKSILAGIDMAMEPNRYQEFIETLTGLVNAGEVPLERIDDAVRRILRVKSAMGLLSERPLVRADRSLLESSFGSAEHRTLAREAVGKSLVLLKNDHATLPLPADNGPYLIAGVAADDLGVQCGGWTIDWQGKRGEATPGGTTLLAALRHELSDPEMAIYKPSGTWDQTMPPKAAVVVVGEAPYAEGNGDAEKLSLSPEDMSVVANVSRLNVPIVLVVLSGRPLELGIAHDAAAAVVAAWLPGTEGAGVADVLFGRTAPTGALSFTWPESTSQQPINSGDDKQPLYPLGHGLTYPSTTH